MSKQRTFQPKIDTLSLLSNSPKYDIKRAIALYGRHSSKEQDGNIATTQQTVGLEKLAFRLGFAQDMHRTFYEDLRGISAYKVPMDERKSYSELYNAIVQGKIGTVLCYMVDRLFRTKNGEEWELFINACVKNNVKVITSASSTRVYDLSISSDADDFRQKCIAARTYIEEIIKGRLNAARDELGLMGLYAGQGVPVGFYVDLDKESPMYQHYLVYEPHAEIVRAIFRRYRELGGAFNKLARELEVRQPVFSLFESLDTLPNIQLGMNEAKMGYVLGREGLMSILTNPAYIGIYIYQGVKIENNHATIVSSDDFFYAFDRLAKFNLEGQEKKTIRTRSDGYSGSVRQGVEALLRDKVESNGEPVGVLSGQKSYEAKSLTRSFVSYDMIVPIATIDSIFAEQLVSMLTVWKEHTRYAQNDGSALVTQVNKSAHALVTDVETIAHEPTTMLASVDDQLPSLRARIAKLRRNLDLDADEKTLEDWAKELKAKVKELARLEAKQKAIVESQGSQEEARKLFQEVPDKWEKWNFEKRRRVVTLALDHVELSEVSPHFLQMKITWALPVTLSVTLFIWRHDGAGNVWTTEEEELLKKHYPSGESREVLEALPRRSWLSIKKRATILGVRRNYRYLEVPRIATNMTMQDMHFMKTHSEVDFTELDATNEVQVFMPKKANLYILAVCS